MEVRFTKSARRHKIGRAHALHVMNTTVPTETVNGLGETEVRFVGPDDRGVELEIAAVVIPGRDRTDTRGTDDLLLVLHVMPTVFRT